MALVLCKNLYLKPQFVQVDAEVSLLYAASLFQNRRVKFLPIMAPGGATVLALISHVEILEVRGRIVVTDGCMMRMVECCG